MKTLKTYGPTLLAALLMIAFAYYVNNTEAVTLYANRCVKIFIHASVMVGATVIALLAVAVLALTIQLVFKLVSKPNNND